MTVQGRFRCRARPVSCRIGPAGLFLSAQPCRRPDLPTPPLLAPFEDALAGAGELMRALAGRQRVRLAVTGLSRAGKTVFLTSLVANLLAAGQGARTLPALEAAAGGRLRRVRLVPAETQSTPRFD